MHEELAERFAAATGAERSAVLTALAQRALALLPYCREQGLNPDPVIVLAVLRADYELRREERRREMLP